MSDGTHVRIEAVGGLVEAFLLDKHVLDELTIDAIGAELRAAISSMDTPRLMVSFENVEHLSSAALGMLITLNNRVKEAGGALCLAAIDGPILDVFRITKLDRIFEIRESVAEARIAVQD